MRDDLAFPNAIRLWLHEAVFDNMDIERLLALIRSALHSGRIGWATLVDRVASCGMLSQVQKKHKEIYGGMDW